MLPKKGVVFLLYDVKAELYDDGKLLRMDNLQKRLCEKSVNDLTLHQCLIKSTTMTESITFKYFPQSVYRYLVQFINKQGIRELFIDPSQYPCILH